MSKFEQIIKDYVLHSHFMGEGERSPEEEAALEKEAQRKREALFAALTMRYDECATRFKLSVAILVISILTLMCLILFTSKGVVIGKQVVTLISGGSVFGLFPYWISLRDEMTKIKQTILIAKVVDTATLNTMLLTLSSAVA